MQSFQRNDLEADTPRPRLLLLDGCFCACWLSGGCVNVSSPEQIGGESRPPGTDCSPLARAGSDRGGVLAPLPMRRLWSSVFSQVPCSASLGKDHGGLSTLSGYTAADAHGSKGETEPPPRTRPATNETKPLGRVRSQHLEGRPPIRSPFWTLAQSPLFSPACPFLPRIFKH